MPEPNKPQRPPDVDDRRMSLIALLGSEGFKWAFNFGLGGGLSLLFLALVGYVLVHTLNMQGKLIENQTLQTDSLGKQTATLGEMKDYVKQQAAEIEPSRKRTESVLGAVKENQDILKTNQKAMNAQLEAHQINQKILTDIAERIPPRDRPQKSGKGPP